MKPREFPPLLFAGEMINAYAEGYLLEQNKYYNEIENFTKTLIVIYLEQLFIVKHG